VESFLQEAIAFTSIYEVVSETLSRMPVRHPRTIGDILEIDRESRTLARELVTSRMAGTVTV
jgi:1-deoxy-D-xylulose-5-phosphate reductoisomerase